MILQPRAGTLIVQMRASRPSTRFSQVPHWPFSQLNLIGARAARTTSLRRWFGSAWTVLLPIVTGTVFLAGAPPALGLLSKDSFLKALSKKPLTGVSGRRGEFGGTSAAAVAAMATSAERRMLGFAGELLRVRRTRPGVSDRRFAALRPAFLRLKALSLSQALFVGTRCVQQQCQGSVRAAGVWLSAGELAGSRRCLWTESASTEPNLGIEGACGRLRARKRETHPLGVLLASYSLNDPEWARTSLAASGGQWRPESQGHPSAPRSQRTHAARRTRVRTNSYGRESAARTKPPLLRRRRRRGVKLHFRVIVQPRAGIFATQTRVTRPSTFDSPSRHWPSSQLNLIGARAARTTSFMRWPGMAWTVRDPILTGTVFFCVLRPLPAFGLLSKDSFLKALSKKPLRGVRAAARCGAFGHEARRQPVRGEQLEGIGQQCQCCLLGGLQRGFASRG